MKSVEDQNVFNLAHQLALKPYATTKATVFITRPFVALSLLVTASIRTPLNQ
jgi:hypothetical protein